MSGVLECECGRRIKLPLPGGATRVRCPNCAEVLTVPVGQQDDDDAPEPLGVVQELTCPGCRRRWPTGTAICIECGHDFRSGKKVRKRVAESEEVVNMGWSGFLKRTRFIVRRDAKGRTWLVKKKWFLFFALKTEEFALADFDAVATDHTQSGNDEEATHYFYLSLEGRKASRSIWSGTNDDAMRRLIDALRRAANLAVKRK